MLGEHSRGILFVCRHKKPRARSRPANTLFACMRVVFCPPALDLPWCLFPTVEGDGMSTACLGILINHILDCAQICSTSTRASHTHTKLSPTTLRRSCRIMPVVLHDRSSVQGCWRVPQFHTAAAAKRRQTQSQQHRPTKSAPAFTQLQPSPARVVVVGGAALFCCLLCLESSTCGASRCAGVFPSLVVPLHSAPHFPVSSSTPVVPQQPAARDRSARMRST